MKKGLFLIFIPFLLVSCGPISSKWSSSCKPSAKGGCQTIEDIRTGRNENVKPNKNEENLKTKLKKEQGKTENIVATEGSFSDFRSKESVARVKFSPYVDEAGNRHDSSVVYYLEQKAEWRK